MNLWTILEVLVRRWRVAAPMLIIAVLVTFRVYASVGPTYEASGQVLLTSPNLSSAGVETQNPFLSFSSSLRTAGEAAAAVLSSAVESARLEGEGLSPYEAVVSSRDPIVFFSATDRSAVKADLTVSRLFARFDEILAQLQSDAGGSTELLIGTTVLQPPSSEIRSSGRLRATLTSALVGVLAVLTVTLAVDELIGGSGRREEV